MAFLFPSNRSQHGSVLQGQFKKAWEDSQNSQLTIVDIRNSVYLEFLSDPDAELVTKSLDEMRTKQVRLLNVRKEKSVSGQIVTMATIYVSKQKRKYVVNEFDEYLRQNTDNGNPWRQKLVSAHPETTTLVIPANAGIQ